MAGGQYLDPYSRDEGCDEHTENIVIIRQQDADCFGKPVESIVQEACKDVVDYGESIDSRETKDGLRLFKQSVWSQPEESRDAQCQLLTHSLWIVDPETLLERELRVGFRQQFSGLPDETAVFTWIDNQPNNPNELRAEIETQFLNVRIADTLSDIESWISGYLGFSVNPNGSEPTVIEWSNEAADEIERIING
ncbi:hypothetical protein PM035_15620 [Halorubrum ezzemoulense]|jgi:hypothetical protein|uniref:hypothetical protein n=1 Tax=Halorubrum ezzemoulense TaxID=337243 RepID=UPI00232D16BA|nr:hypothetical protein [Halorubrum ezzemoulense]MDB2262255.1 hypothetical protein [Halorubrum ezzemoulense]MDB2269096.1 hypothetical protein [Halorubrum ezzemoulense]